MSSAQIRKIRRRYEAADGDLQGLVHLKMLGQGYDFPPICVVVPMRPYGSYGEFYQFLGRGIRSIQGLRCSPRRQRLDLVFHSELGFEGHLSDVAAENDMGLLGGQWAQVERDTSNSNSEDDVGAAELAVIVTYEHGVIRSESPHTDVVLHQARLQRAAPFLAQHYAEYVQSTANPVSFDQFVAFVKAAKANLRTGAVAARHIKVAAGLSHTFRRSTRCVDLEQREKLDLASVARSRPQRENARVPWRHTSNSCGCC